MKSIAAPHSPRIVDAFTVRAAPRGIDATTIGLLLVALALVLIAATAARVRAERNAGLAAIAVHHAEARSLAADVVANLYREQAATRSAVTLARAVDRADVAAARTAVGAALARLEQHTGNDLALAARLRILRPEVTALEAVFSTELRWAQYGNTLRAQQWFARDRQLTSWVVGAFALP